MELSVAAGGLTVQSEVNFLFALGKAYEDRGDFERGVALLREGNTKQRAEVVLRPGADGGHERPARAASFPQSFSQSRSGVGNPDPAPIFILGLPRSGSTLLEQILASHSEVEGTSELPYLARVTTWLNRNRAEGINYPGGGARAARRRTSPGSASDYLGYAQHASPPGRAALHRQDAEQLSEHRPARARSCRMRSIIDARRHPLDACLSCYRQLFAKGQAFTYDLTEIGEYYLQYQRMMDHWAQVLPGRVLTVQYEEVVADFETQVRRLLEFCGLPWEEACLRFYESDRPVRTPSSEQVRQPIYDRSVGHWQHYAAHLDELIDGDRADPRAIPPVRAPNFSQWAADAGGDFACVPGERSRR